MFDPGRLNFHVNEGFLFLLIGGSDFNKLLRPKGSSKVVEMEKAAEVFDTGQLQVNSSWVELLTYLARIHEVSKTQMLTVEMDGDTIWS